MVAHHIALLHFSAILLNNSSDKKVNLFHVSDVNLCQELLDFDLLLNT